MIFDKVSNFSTYINIHPRFKKVKEWLDSVDLSTLESGSKIEIDGKNIYAKVDEYETHPSYKKTFEGHIKYIDIQIITYGYEKIEVAMLNGTEDEDIPYDEIKERYKVKTQEDCNITIKDGEFAVFFPQDLHKPCINPSYKKEKVKKVVIKVLL